MAVTLTETVETVDTPRLRSKHKQERTKMPSQQIIISKKLNTARVTYPVPLAPWAGCTMHPAQG